MLGDVWIIVCQISFTSMLLLQLQVRAGRYGQNLYHDIFLNFGRYDIIPISIWTLLKKASKKLPRMPTTDVCTYELMKNEFAKSMNSSYKTIYYFRGGKTAQIN